MNINDCLDPRFAPEGYPVRSFTVTHQKQYKNGQYDPEYLEEEFYSYETARQFFLNYLNSDAYKNQEGDDRPDTLWLTMDFFESKESKECYGEATILHADPPHHDEEYKCMYTRGEIESYEEK